MTKDWLKSKQLFLPVNNPEISLYSYMARKTFIPFHELSLEEKSMRLEDKLLEAEQANLKKGSYRGYKNELCASQDLFIKQYAGRKELVSVDVETGRITLIEKLA